MDHVKEDIPEMSERFPCPCCGALTLEKGNGKYEICPICLWEDDPVQKADPDFAGGANRLSLNESRARWSMREQI